MASFPSKGFLLVQLLLLLSCFQEASCSFPPVGPPIPQNSDSLIPAPERFIAVQGVVYCKSCQHTLDNATTITGAEVKLLCKDTRFPMVATAKTDQNGYFFLQAPPTVTSFAFFKCQVFLVSSPIDSCSQPSDLNGGLTGATLRWEISSLTLPFNLYSVGPFAFEPLCRAPGAM